MAIVTGEIEYITLRKVRAHYELYIPDDELDAFNQLPENEKREMISYDGELLVDDFSVDDIGEIYEIYVMEVMNKK